MATGFTLLAGILTFFGIKEGLLDRILRSYPRQSLLVFCLIGLSVLAGTVAPILKVDWRVRTVLVVAAIGVLALLVGYALPNFAPAEDQSVATVFVILATLTGLLLLILLRHTMMPIVAAALVVGVTSLALGLYGAVKLSVGSKLNPETPIVLAGLKEVSGAQSVEISLKASKLDDSEYLAVVATASKDDAADREIGRANVYPDSAGSIDRILNFGLPNERVTEISVRSRVCKASSSCEVRSTDQQSYLRILGPRSSAFIGGSVSQGDTPSKAAVSFSAASLQQDMVVALTLTETSGGTTVDRATVRLAPDATGAITWTSTIAVKGAEGTQLAIKYATCASSSPCDGPQSVLATYLYPVSSTVAALRPVPGSLPRTD